MAVIGALCLASQAKALEPGTLRESLFGPRITATDPHAGQPIARYVSQEGDVFVLDRSQPRPLLKFDDNPEVWVLRSQLAPRGDILYMNDLGAPVLRATRLVGLTLFTDDRPGGTAAALAGRAARRLSPFEADASPGSSALTADAAMIAAEAIIRIAKRSDAKVLLSRIGKVRVVEGRKSQAQISEGVVRITVSPADGIAGRPSSDRIVATVGGR